MTSVTRPEVRAPTAIAGAGVRRVEASATVIVVNYNGRAHVETCLRSLLADGRPNTEVVVVDNCSTDGSADLIAARFPQVRLLRNEDNHGFGHGCNLAASVASGEYLVFLNPDTEVRAGWIDALIEALETHPGAGLATSRILLAGTPDRLNAAGNELHFTGLSLCRGVGVEREAFDHLEEIGLISGAAFAIRRRLFEKLGGFDASFFLYVEDTDLSLRARLAGYTCLYVPRSEVLHDYELRFGPGKLFYLERNRYLLLLKAFRWRTLAAMLPSLALVEAVTWGYVMSSQRHRAAEKLRAYAWIVRHWRTVLAARRQTQARRAVSDATILRACTAELDFGQTGRSPMTALANAIGNPALRVLYAAACATVRD